MNTDGSATREVADDRQTALLKKRRVNVVRLTDGVNHGADDLVVGCGDECTPLVRELLRLTNARRPLRFRDCLDFIHEVIDGFAAQQVARQFEAVGKSGRIEPVGKSGREREEGRV